MINKQMFKLKKDGTLCKNCFCRTPDLIENYDKAIADTTQTWQCHHRLETHNSDGERRLVDISKEELIALGMYYDRPPEELIFLTPIEHIGLHQKGKPKTKSEETKKKMSEAHKGKHLSEEHRRKMSEAHRGKHRSEEIRKRMSEAHKDHKVSEETKRKVSEAHKGKHWKLVDGKRVWY